MFLAVQGASGQAGRGLLRAPYGTGRLSVARPGRPKGRTAGPTWWDMLAHGRRVDGGGWGTLGDGWKRLGTARMTSLDDIIEI